MTGQDASVSLHVQNTGHKPFLFERLETWLKAEGLTRFRAAVAYARWDGIGLIAPSVEAFLAKGGELQTIYGAANGVTTPDALLYGLYLQELYATHTYCGVVEDKFANATFHPKFFEFTFPGKIVAIVGSANLTGGGLSRNAEAQVEVESKRGDQFEHEIEAAWTALKGASQQATLNYIRTLKSKSYLGSEQNDNETNSGKADKPHLSVAAKTAPKPLFAKVLDLKAPAKKSKILAKLDPITEQPHRLFLQILTGETGAPSGAVAGYQIQLPVATLAAFFGVGAAQTKLATFNFGTETISVHLTHFENNTHRVRLRPLRDVARPAIVIFERAGPDKYDCSIVPGNQYSKVLAQKCTEQTRAGARRWGLE